MDDGYSGTNFQRPSFQNMIKDIENGLINCVITKDLSRLGRNYLDCGLYLESVIPFENIKQYHFFMNVELQMLSIF